MSSHGACAVSLVEALVDVFCGELEVAVATHGEGLGWSHFEIGWMLSHARWEEWGGSGPVGR